MRKLITMLSVLSIIPCMNSVTTISGTGIKNEFYFNDYATKDYDLAIGEMSEMTVELKNTFTSIQDNPVILLNNYGVIDNNIVCCVEHNADKSLYLLRYNDFYLQFDSDYLSYIGLEECSDLPVLTYKEFYEIFKVDDTSVLNILNLSSYASTWYLNDGYKFHIDYSNYNTTDMFEDYVGYDFNDSVGNNTILYTNDEFKRFIEYRNYTDNMTIQLTDNYTDFISLTADNFTYCKSNDYGRDNLIKILSSSLSLYNASVVYNSENQVDALHIKSCFDFFMTRTAEFYELNFFIDGVRYYVALDPSYVNEYVNSFNWNVESNIDYMMPTQYNDLHYYDLVGGKSNFANYADEITSLYLYSVSNDSVICDTVKLDDYKFTNLNSIVISSEIIIGRAYFEMVYQHSLIDIHGEFNKFYPTFSARKGIYEINIEGSQQSDAKQYSGYITFNNYRDSKKPIDLIVNNWYGDVVCNNCESLQNIIYTYDGVKPVKDYIVKVYNTPMLKAVIGYYDMVNKIPDTIHFAPELTVKNIKPIFAETTTSVSTSSVETTVNITTTNTSSAVSESTNETINKSASSFKGDLTLDNTLDLRDSMLLKRYLVNNAALTVQQVNNADILTDGIVDIRDNGQLNKYLLGVITSL